LVPVGGEAYPLPRFDVASGSRVLGQLMCTAISAMSNIATGFFISEHLDLEKCILVMPTIH
jgi:hypothetical protein